MIRVRAFEDPGAFAAHAESWLLRDEAANNLLLGILRRPLLAGPEPAWFASLEDDGTIVGCAFRTPPFKLGVTAMPDAAVPPLVAAVHDVYASLPAVLGSERVAGPFARGWATLTGATVRPGKRQGIYRLERVVPPAHPAPGRVRVATPEDVGLVVPWIEAFNEDVGIEMRPARELADERLALGAWFLWEDGGPRCLAGWGATTPNGVRVGPVYTPPEFRGRGYATAATAAVSRRALEDGRRFCFLYTDLANPVSNRIYQRIGYERITDVMDIHFD